MSVEQFDRAITGLAGVKVGVVARARTGEIIGWQGHAYTTQHPEESQWLNRLCVFDAQVTTETHFQPAPPTKDLVACCALELVTSWYDFEIRLENGG